LYYFIIVNIHPLQFKTYLATIQNSIGSNTFRNAFAQIDATEKDITQDGEYSCAFFASAILLISKYIKEMHTTVPGTQRDLEQSGWIKIEEPRIGAVLVWEAILDNHQENHMHIGFSIGDHQAISNSSESKTPQQHHWTYGEKDGTPVRRVLAIYWNPQWN
jgi:hypothetical protein